MRIYGIRTMFCCIRNGIENKNSRVGIGNGETARMNYMVINNTWTMPFIIWRHKTFGSIEDLGGIIILIVPSLVMEIRLMLLQQSESIQCIQTMAL